MVAYIGGLGGGVHLIGYKFQKLSNKHPQVIGKEASQLKLRLKRGKSELLSAHA